MTSWKVPTDPDALLALNRLSREQMKLRLLADIQHDMMVCRLEGWDALEYTMELAKMIESIVEREKMTSRKTADIYDTACHVADQDTVVVQGQRFVRERTCHDFGGEEGTSGEGYDFACSACGYCCDLPQPNHCPSCGAKVIANEMRKNG